MDDIEKILDIIFKGKISIKALAELEPAKKDIQALLDRYRHTPPNRTAATTEESAAITRRIVELRGKGLREGGKTYQEIEKILWDEGIRGTKGQRLTAVAIRHRLDSARKSPHLVPIRTFSRGVVEQNQSEPHSHPHPAMSEMVFDSPLKIKADALDDLIFPLKDSGLGAKEIVTVLQEKHNLPVDWLFVRARLIARGRWGKADAEAEGGAQEVQTAPPQENKPETLPECIKVEVRTVPYPMDAVLGDGTINTPPGADIEPDHLHDCPVVKEEAKPKPGCEKCSKPLGAQAVATGGKLYCSQACAPKKVESMPRGSRASAKKEVTLSERDVLILDLDRDGIGPTAIATRLGKRFGGPYDADFVKARLKELKTELGRKE